MIQKTSDHYVYGIEVTPYRHRRVMATILILTPAYVGLWDDVQSSKKLEKSMLVMG